MPPPSKPLPEYSYIYPDPEAPEPLFDTYDEVATPKKQMKMFTTFFGVLALVYGAGAYYGSKRVAPVEDWENKTHRQKVVEELRQLYGNDTPAKQVNYLPEKAKENVATAV